MAGLISDVQLTVVDPEDDEARMCLQRYFAELAKRYAGGYDPRQDEVGPEDFRPPHGLFLLLRIDGRACGCGSWFAAVPGVAEIRRVWVGCEARGHGLGALILRTLEDRARDQGFTRIRLDSHDMLAEAQALYRRAGYKETAPFSNSPYVNRWWAKSLA